MDQEYFNKRKKKFLMQSAIWYVFLALLTYFLPKVMLFYVVCGLYDVTRNGITLGKKYVNNAKNTYQMADCIKNFFFLLLKYS